MAEPPFDYRGHKLTIAVLFNCFFVTLYQF